MDETARAIANAREQQAEADKPVGPKRTPDAGSVPLANQARGRERHRASGGPTTVSSTIRPKQPGS